MERLFLLQNSEQWTESLPSESQDNGNQDEQPSFVIWAELCQGFLLLDFAEKGVCRLCQILSVQPYPRNLPVLVPAHIPHLIFYLLKGNESTSLIESFNGISLFLARSLFSQQDCEF